VEEGAEVAVARDAALTVAQDVDGRHVAGAGDVAGCNREVQEAQVVAVVMVGDGAGVVDAEGVEGVGEGVRGGVVDKRAERVSKCEGGDGYGGRMSASREREEGDVVGDERMHAVDGDEFFG